MYMRYRGGGVGHYQVPIPPEDDIPGAQSDDEEPEPDPQPITSTEDPPERAPMPLLDRPNSSLSQNSEASRSESTSSSDSSDSDHQGHHNKEDSDEDSDYLGPDDGEGDVDEEVGEGFVCRVEALYGLVCRIRPAGSHQGLAGFPAFGDGKAMAAMMERMEDLEVSNDDLRAENKAQRKLLDAFQITIPASRFSRPHRSYECPHLLTALRILLLYLTAARRALLPSVWPQKLNMKRPRTEPAPVFISFGPVIESTEPPVKYFELHVQTAIPSFVLAAPYQVQRDPVYPGHLRVKLASESVAKSFIDAWGRQTVVGYSKIKIYKMGSVSGNEPRTNNQSQSGLVRGDARNSREDYSREDYGRTGRYSESGRH
ncbi:hypothetical protein C8R43DRAFT_943075 [Mycena crocata]|nr:hypothetical protein C8R43DRAFT_943075 [Mycena crocata]